MDPSSLIEIYAAENEQEAHIVRAWLADAGIESIVSGGELQQAGGELPLGFATAPRILASADMSDRARDLALEWEQAKNEAQAQQNEEWQCQDCGEINAASFEMCWNCFHSAG